MKIKKQEIQQVKQIYFIIKFFFIKLVLIQFGKEMKTTSYYLNKKSGFLLYNKSKSEELSISQVYEPEIKKKIKSDQVCVGRGKISYLFNQFYKVNEDSITIPLAVYQILQGMANQDDDKRSSSDSSQSFQSEDTKNLLRNFGNALNRFILTNKHSNSIISQWFDQENQKINCFKRWVVSQKLENFEQFKRIWSSEEQEDEIVQEFKEVFANLSFEFYSKHAFCYVMNSQMRSENTKKTHIKYISRFLEGILCPQSFYYFKKQ